MRVLSSIYPVSATRIRTTNTVFPQRFVVKFSGATVGSYEDGSIATGGHLEHEANVDPCSFSLLELLSVHEDNFYSLLLL